MLRLWPDRLYAVLYPNKVEFVHHRSGWRSQPIHADVIYCDSGDSSRPIWELPVAALRSRLQTLSKRTHLTLTLSSHFVHYAVIPWPDTLVAREERQAWARICFEKKYGDLVRHWDLHMSDAGFGQSCIASGVERALLTAVQDACEMSKARLVSLQPMLMCAINQVRKELKGKSKLIFLAEPTHVSILRLVANEIVALKAAAIVSDLEAELEVLKSREAILTTISTKPYLVLSEDIAIGTKTANQFQVLKCPSFSRGNAGKFQQRLLSLLEI